MYHHLLKLNGFGQTLGSGAVPNERIDNAIENIAVPSQNVLVLND
jgi:hypothetical protein